jgi:hypothetical protein
MTVSSRAGRLKAGGEIKRDQRPIVAETSVYRRDTTEFAVICIAPMPTRIYRHFFLSLTNPCAYSHAAVID